MRQEIFVLALVFATASSWAFAPAGRSRREIIMSSRVVCEHRTFFKTAIFEQADDADGVDAAPPAAKASGGKKMDWRQPSIEDHVEVDTSDEERMTLDELEACMGDWDTKVPGYSSLHLSGRIGNNPVPRELKDGKVVLNLSLASKRKYHWLEREAKKIQYGEEQTDWYSLEIWGRLAEYVAKYVDKGARVSVIGQLTVDRWQDKETQQPRTKAKVIVRDFEFLETRRESEARRSRRGQYNNNQYQQQQQTYSGGGAAAGSSYDDSYRGRSIFMDDDDDDSGGGGSNDLPFKWSASGDGGFY